MDAVDKSKIDTQAHQEVVKMYINRLVSMLHDRAAYHDATKLISPELEVFAEYTPKLAKTTFGSTEYSEQLQEMQVALKHHYANNRHHPEFYFINERWEDIKGYEGLYQISDMGRVKSLDRISSRETTGDIYNQGKILKFNITPKGYCRIQLTSNGVNKNFMVHQLVAQAFIPNDCITRTMVNHKNGIKTCNIVNNLEWCTSSENLIHAYDCGFKKASVKYIIKCNELNIVTEGCDRMEHELRRLGYEKARASAIWRVINGKTNTHLDLTFEVIIPEERTVSPFAFMNLIDLIELVCDWKSSSLRQNPEKAIVDIEKNQERFGYSDDLAAILKNTVELFELI